MKKALKALLFTVIFSLLFAITAYFTAPYWLQWTLKTYFHQKGVELSFADAKWSGSEVTFHDVLLERLENSYQMTLSAPVLQVVFGFDPSLKVDLILEKPFLTLAQSEGTSGAASLPTNPRSSSGFFTPEVSLTLKEGYLVLDDSSPKIWRRDLSGAIRFDKGRIKGDLAIGNKDSGLLQLILDTEADDFKATVRLQKLLMVDLVKLAEFGAQRFDSQFVVNTGSVTGVITAVQNATNRRLLQVNGKMLVEDLSVLNESTEIQTDIPKIRVDIMPLTYPSATSGETLWQNVLSTTFLEAQIVGQGTMSRFRENAPYWMARNLTGRLSLNAAEECSVTASLQGQFFYKEDKAAALQMKFCYPFKEFAEATIDVLLTQGAKEPAVLKANFNPQKIDLHLVGIGPREFEIARDFMKDLSPIWSETNFEAGHLTADVSIASLGPSSLEKKIIVQQIIAEDLQFEVPHLRIEGKVTSLKGAGELYLNRGHKALLVQNAVGSLQEGDFYWTLDDKPESELEHLSHINGAFVIEEGRIKNASLKANLAGIQGSVVIYSGVEKAFDFKAEGPLKKLFSLAGNTKLAESVGSLAGDTFSVNGSVAKTDFGLNVTSDIVLKSLDGLESHLSLQVHLKRLLRNALGGDTTLWHRWGIALLASSHPQASFSKVLHVKWLKDKAGSYYVSLDQVNMNMNELQLARYMPLSLQSGYLSANVQLAPLKKGSAWDMGLSFDQLHIRDLSYKKDDVQVYAKDIEGTISAHINDRKRLLYIDKASLRGTAGGYQIGHISLEQISSRLEVSKGLIDLLDIKAMLGGLSLSFDFYGLREASDVASFSLQGSPEALLKALDPELVSPGDISYTGQITRGTKGLKLDSLFKLDDSSLSLRADLGRVPVTGTRGEAPLWCHLGSCLYELPGFSQKLFARAFKLPLLRDKEGPYVIKLDAIYVNSMSFLIDTPLSALLEKYMGMRIAGTIETQGKITDEAWQAGFSLKKASLENSEGAYFAEEMGGYDHEQKKWLGLFLYNPQTGSLLQAPFTGGIYHNKPLGLHFTNSSGRIRLKGTSLQVLDIRAESEGLKCTGNVTLDYAKEDGYGLEIKTTSINASLPHAQRFGLQFADLPFLHYQSSGNISSLDGGFFLKGFVPYNETKADVQWILKAAIMDGTLTDKHLTLSHINTSFTYDSLKKRLQTDIKDVILDALGERYNVAELLLDASWQEGLRGSLSFKASLPGENLFYTEVKASLTSEEEQLIFSLANDSYFGGLRFMADKIILSPEGDLVACKGQAAWQMSSFFDDSTRLLGLVGQKSSLSTLKETTRLGGAIKIDCDYEADKASVRLSGKNFKVKGKEIEPFGATISMVKGEWLLQKGQYRDLILTASAQVEEGRLIIQEISGTKAGVDFEGSGQFVFATKDLQLSLNHMSIDLARVHYAKKWQPLTAIWQPQGHIVVVGSLQGQFTPENTEFSWKASAVTEGIVLRGNRLQTEGPVALRYNTKKGLSIDDVKLSMKRQGTGAYLASVAIKGARYDSDNLSIDDIAFAFPTNYIREIVLLGEQLFPTLFDDTTRSLLNDIKREGGLKGNVELDFASEQLRIKIRLSDGTYQYAGRTFTLQDVVLDYGEKGFEIGARYRVQKALLDIRLLSKSGTSGSGQLLVSLASEPRSVNNLLVCDWIYQKENGLLLQKIQGAAFGLQVALSGAANLEKQNFGGSIKMVDRVNFEPLLPDTLKNFLQKWQITTGYMIKGQWSFDKSSLEEFQFKGQLLGQQFTLLGNTLQQASGELKIDFRTIQLQQWHVTDPGVTMDMPSLLLSRDKDDEWRIKLGLLQITNLRLADLKRAEPISKRLRSVLIKRAVLRNLQGSLSDLKTLTGNGEFVFDKIKSSSLGSQLMSIPGDILGRLGLNLSVLSPASGTIEFKIEDQKVIITKMRDVYSDGKMSRFYLPKPPLTSYIDFDGRLNITLRMKQYNLLLKLAEALSISIKGKWDDPEFSLQKSS